MSSTSDSPWPTQTPPPKRKRHTKQLVPRQSTYSKEIADAKEQCQVFSGNEVVSCFPKSNTVYVQGQWTEFVWNSRTPDLTQINRVNLFLYNGDSRAEILSLKDQINPSNQPGSVNVEVDDRWWGADGDKWNGKNITNTYYWVVKRADQQLDGSEFTQAHFTAIQTTYANSVIASMSSASSASSASAASASAASVSAASVSRTATTSIPSGTGPNGNIQAGSSGSSFPKWAIAVIVILGFFAIATTCILIFFIMRRLRKRRAAIDNRNSMGSSSPMMAHANNGEPQSPLLASHTGHDHRDIQSSVGHGGNYAAAGAAAGAGLNRAPSLVSPDGASTISRAGSAGEGGPFSGADAAIMADAFRKALRKPDFAGGPPEEGESPENPEAKSELLSRELAEEGRDIRSVSSSRGVRVETMSDSGDTVHDTPR